MHNLHTLYAGEERRRIVIYVCGHVTRTGDRWSPAQTMLRILLEICFRSQTRCAVNSARTAQCMDVPQSCRRHVEMPSCAIFIGLCTNTLPAPRLSRRGWCMHLTTTRNGIDCAGLSILDFTPQLLTLFLFFLIVYLFAVVGFR